MDRLRDLRWYLIHCKAHEEARALEHLERQGYTCFRPMQHRERRRLGRKCLVTEALFPRYLFIRLDSLNDNWHPICSTRGVQHFVRFTDQPLPVADSIIDGIRLRLSEETVEPYLRPGERVQITHGAFSQLEAIFVANDGEERVVLLLNVLQREQELRFPMNSVRRIRP